MGSIVKSDVISRCIHIATNVQLNIPFCAEMNAESIAILQAMICETKHEIQGGW